MEYELADGEVVMMSAAPILLLKLRNSEHKTAYREMSKVIMSQETETDIIGIYNFLYGAYLCANIDDEHMGYAEFLERANQDIAYSTGIMGGLLKPQKKQDSAPLSETQ